MKREGGEDITSQIKAEKKNGWLLGAALTIKQLTELRRLQQTNLSILSLLKESMERKGWTEQRRKAGSKEERKCKQREPSWGK